MGDKSNIEWTDATWNPIVGCSIVSPGCTNCYAMKMAARIERMNPGGHYDGTTKTSKAGAVWTGSVALAPEHILYAPLRWKAPRLIFANSMGDLFHESITDAMIDRAFAVMARCPQHTFQVLTKRSDRMRRYFASALRRSDPPPNVPTLAAHQRVWGEMVRQGGPCAPPPWPLPNVWLGVSTERQKEADERIYDLQMTPAAVRFLSVEPLLGPVNLEWVNDKYGAGTVLEPAEVHGGTGQCVGLTPAIDWVIVGGESGPGARPMHPDWVRTLRDQCATADVPFFFKQWGEYAPVPIEDPAAYTRGGKFKGFRFERIEGYALVHFGKKGSGRKLDGVEHNDMPRPREFALT